MKHMIASLSALCLLTVLSSGVAHSETTPPEARSQSGNYVRIEDIQAKTPSGEAVNLMSVTEKPARDQALKESQAQLQQFKKHRRCGRMINFNTCN